MSIQFPTAPDLFPYTNSNEALTIQKIEEALIPELLSYLSQANLSISSPSIPSDNTAPTTINNNGDRGGSSSGGGSSGGNSSNNGDTSNSKNSRSSSNNYNSNNGDVDNSSNGNNNSSNNLHHLLDKLQRILNSVKEAVDSIKKFEVQVGDLIRTRVLHILNEVFSEIKQVQSGSVQPDQIHAKLRKLDNIVRKLKNQVPSSDKISSANADVHRHLPLTHMVTVNGVDADNVFDWLPDLHRNEKFQQSWAFKDFEVIYESLDIQLKLCLLCFSVFPENAVIKRRLLIYWWVGEGFLAEERPEKLADKIFEELEAKGFIQPFSEKRCLESDSFKMHPFVRSVVIVLAKRVGFFDLDSKGNPTANFSWSYRAGLVKADGRSSQWDLTNAPDQDKLHTLFNVSEPYLDFKLEWFSKMKNVNVLCLGRWHSSANHHIEVEDTEFLKGLKNMKHLRYLSLQGISRITELPDTFSKLSNLIILDLRACHNLEALPEGIASLSKLTHLDMSECYLLDHVPKGVALLSELQVLEGFVIGESKGRNSCGLEDLTRLGKLRKLSINTTRKSFPTEKELIAFQSFKVLRKLTITWGGDSSQAKPGSTVQPETGGLHSTAAGTPSPGAANPKQDKGARESATAAITNTASRKFTRLLSKSRTMKTPPAIAALPVELEKLELRCFPWTKAPEWLVPGKLMNLTKLYVRGGKLGDLGEVHSMSVSWKVKILRLKFLDNLEMDWRELQKNFPGLIYLEKVNCPKLTFFPCDENGVWMKTKEST